MPKQAVYIHKEDCHNTVSPSEIVPVLIDLFAPKSVVDIGCGIGTFLHYFAKAGVPKTIGIDGKWVNIKQLSEYIPEHNFVIADLEIDFSLNERFDLAICLEVAEHLKESSADLFISNLVKLSDIIVFSAAVPNQGGQNHINEQWTSYWQEKFKKHGYTFHDVLRPIFWNNSKVDYWYKQNMFLVTNKDISLWETRLKKYTSEEKIIPMIHPDLFNNRTEHLHSYEKIFKSGLKGYIEFLQSFFKRKF
jgi:SAM-dependent methyltransferase